MNTNQNPKDAENPQEQRGVDPQELMQDPAVESALRDFRLSVHAWSDAAYSRARTPFEFTPHAMAWRRATAWGLGCVLAAALAVGGVTEHRYRQEAAQATAARAQEHSRLLAEEHAREAEDLLAKVDSAIARQVPDAMEPLAQLMAEDESR
jgi:hypothetical protein